MTHKIILASLTLLLPSCFLLPKQEPIKVYRLVCRFSNNSLIFSSDAIVKESFEPIIYDAENQVFHVGDDIVAKSDRHICETDIITKWRNVK